MGEKLSKKAGASDMVLRGVVIPSRQSMTPVVAPSAPGVFKEQVAGTSATQVRRHLSLLAIFNV